MARKQNASFLKLHYDKILVLASLLLLVGSLVALISATSNWVVRAYAVTNTFPCVTLCVTNALSSEITCSSGVGMATPNDKYVAPGDPIFFEGTAKGRVKVILTR